MAVLLEWALRERRAQFHSKQVAPLQAAEGRTPPDTARHLDTTPRTITAALHRMRDRYNFPTNEALIAVAVKLEWIPLAIDTTDDPKRRRDQAGEF